MSRYCYTTGEDHRREDGRYVIARVREDRTGFVPAMVVDTLDEAQMQTTTFNSMLGLSVADVAHILTKAKKEKSR